MTINDKTYAIAMTRGDSESISVQCTSDPFSAGDVVTLTVRDDAEGEVLLQKAVDVFDDGVAVIGIAPADTAGIEFGSYVYDIQSMRADGTVLTLIPPRPGRLPTFELTEEATY